jgi:hypothetical protein
MAEINNGYTAKLAGVGSTLFHNFAGTFAE